VLQFYLSRVGKAGVGLLQSTARIEFFVAWKDSDRRKDLFSRPKHEFFIPVAFDAVAEVEPLMNEVRQGTRQRSGGLKTQIIKVWRMSAICRY
jgi:hypothetical protein